MNEVISTFVHAWHSLTDYLSCSPQVFPEIAGTSEEPLGARRCLSGERESLNLVVHRLIRRWVVVGRDKKLYVWVTRGAGFNWDTCILVQLGSKRIHQVRTRGGNVKYRAMRLDQGNFSWGSEGASLIHWRAVPLNNLSIIVHSCPKLPHK